MHRVAFGCHTRHLEDEPLEAWLHDKAEEPFLERGAWPDASMPVALEVEDRDGDTVEDRNEDIVVDRGSLVVDRQDKGRGSSGKAEVAAFDHNTGSSFVHLLPGCKDPSGGGLLRDTEEEVHQNNHWVDGKDR